MKNKDKSKKGSVTILIIYIFLVVSIFSSIIISFAMLQASLSRNQLKKVQDKYSTEDYLNKIVYDDSFIDTYLKEPIYEKYRRGLSGYPYELYVKPNKDSRFDGRLKSSSFKIKDIYGRPYLEILLSLNYDNITRNVIAYGPCFNDIYATRRCLLEESKLSEKDRVIFQEFIGNMEQENLDYDYRYKFNDLLNAKIIKVNEDENLAIKLGSSRENKDELFSEKSLERISQDKIKILNYFKVEDLVLDLRGSHSTRKTLTIGDLEEEGLIKVAGAFYLEGDLVINQDFEFQGLIIINNGRLIVNTDKKPKIEGMVLLRGESDDLSKLKLIYNEDYTYKAGSYLPGFFDIKVDTIKSY